MKTNWLLTIKPTFNEQWLALPTKESRQIHEKITLLMQDPIPDAKVKKQLKYMNGKLYRLRSGDYRIFYTFEKPYISLLTLRRRDDATYDDELEVEFLGGIDPQFDGIERTSRPNWEHLFAPYISEKRKLPKPITVELLVSLQIPTAYYTKLLSITTEDELLNALDISEDVLIKLIEHMFPKLQTLEQIIQQPEYILTDVDDLLCLKTGDDILNLLLRLNSEQERAANWALNASGPTQVKGKPGTGKSTVAIYRVRSLLQNLYNKGERAPRILFTTYTNALVMSSKQLLQRLLGDGFNCIDVQTTDSLMLSLLKKADKITRILEDGTLSWFIQEAVRLARDSYLQLPKNISNEYLLEEICQVIVARKIISLQEYLQEDRTGHRVGLGDAERRAVWHVYEILLQKLESIKAEMWQQMRVRAETIFSEDSTILHYDGVIVDEAQDLDPSVLRILIKSCKSPNRFFITADANQSIYKCGFTWKDVDESLNFQGRRTTTLKTNYRSTRQIGEAAQSYLVSGAVEVEPMEWLHKSNGSLPIVRYVQSEADELYLLKNFLSKVAYEFHLGLDACAILCPTKDAGRELVMKLKQYGIPATFMSRQSVNLKQVGVKVLTFHLSKGLEFPVVVLAGFVNSHYTREFEGVSEDEQREVITRYRRILFVAMTRAMHTLLVLVPGLTNTPLLTGFDPTYWNKV